MIRDAVRLLAGPLLAAIVGGLIVHFATRRRDAENERRRQRIDYLLSAYRTLTHSAHRELSGEQAEAFEDALSDVMLFGNADQIRLARETIKALAEDGGASIDALLVSFRSGLRQELDLARDGLKMVPVVRFRSLNSPDTPLKMQESWTVRAAETTNAAAAASAASTTALAAKRTTTSFASDLRSQVENARELAHAAPGAGVVASYGYVLAALRNLVAASEDDRRDAPELAQAARDQGLTTAQLVDTVQGLAILKDLSRRDGAGTGLSVDKAEDFIDLAAAALYIIYTATSEPQ